MIARLRSFAALVAVAVVSVVGVGTVSLPSSAFAATCNNSGSFFGLPHWYEGLQKSQGSECNIVIDKTNATTAPWTIATNLLDILLRLVGVVAVIFIIVGGIRYIISQGESAGITAAKQTITRAIVGLVISLLAVFILNFVIGLFGLRTSGDTYKVQESGAILTESVS